MYQAIENVVADLEFKGPRSVFSDAGRTRALCDALTETANRLQEERANSAEDNERHDLKTLCEGFRAAARLVCGLQESVRTSIVL